MSLYKSVFKSVEILVEQPGRSAGSPPAAKPKTSLDINNSTNHHLVLGMKDFLNLREWTGRFFFTLASAGFALALVYGALTLGRVVSLGRTPFTAAEWIFSVSAVFVFCAAWGALSVKAVIRSAKDSLVVRERGRGNWKIMDEKEFSKTARVLLAVKEREAAEKEKERIESERSDRARFHGGTGV